MFITYKRTATYRKWQWSCVVLFGTAEQRILGLPSHHLSAIDQFLCPTIDRPVLIDLHAAVSAESIMIGRCIATAAGAPTCRQAGAEPKQLLFTAAIKERRTEGTHSHSVERDDESRQHCVYRRRPHRLQAYRHCKYAVQGNYLRNKQHREHKAVYLLYTVFVQSGGSIHISLTFFMNDLAIFHFVEHLLYSAVHRSQCDYFKQQIPIPHQNVFT